MTERTFTTGPVETHDADALSFIVDDGTPIRLMDGRTVYACGPIAVSEQPPPAKFSPGTVFGEPSDATRATNDRSHVGPADFGCVVSPAEINAQNKKFREQKGR